MTASLALILLCQLAGEALVRGLSLPMPGPVIGLMLLLVLLLLRDRFTILARGPLQADGVESTSRGLLANLSLLFVPAGVGVVQKLDLIVDHGVAFLGVLVISVLITLVVTVAITVTPLMNRMRITDFRARGFAVGIAAHGIGTARAFQVDAVAGVFAGIAMSLNALVTSLLVPLAVTFLLR